MENTGHFLGEVPKQLPKRAFPIVELISVS